VSAAPWGASPDEWRHFAQHLGLVRDLLPVVSNPGAKISPQSKMRDLGKTPSRYNADREVVGIPSWTTRESTDKQVSLWARDADLGICLQTRVVRAIDVDIGDPVEAQRVAQFIELGLGVDLPRRQRADSGKFLLAFQMPGEFAKRVIRTAHGAIEFLATGQQFIAVGTHPKGARYEWVPGLPAEIPELVPAEFEALWQGLVDAFALPGGSSVATRGVLPSIPRSALDMHGDPKVAWLQENGWVREFDRDGRVHIRCPWEDQHTSDSGPSATSYFPAGVGGINAGHYKCLHAHCSGRDDGAFDAAVGWTAALFEVVEAGQGGAAGDEPADWPPFTRDRQGRIECTATNTALALARSDVTGWRLGWDEFLGARVIAEHGASEWRLFKDSDYFLLRQALEARGFKGPGQDLVREAVRLVAEQNSFDSAIAWAEGLRWDGKPRVARFFERYLGAVPSEYSSAVGRYLWTALAARCLEPGAKVDMVPVLISTQGTGKTSMVEAIAPTIETFTEINLEQRDDQLSRQLRGKLVGEIAELRGLASREAESIKAWITRRHEEIRNLYSEFHAKYPRRLVLIGTGNKDEFLDDETGERRWLPLRVGVTDLDALRRDRDQLWAEGIALWRAEGLQWRVAQTLATEQHAEFKVHDSWEEVVAFWLNSDAMDGPEGPRRGDTPFSLAVVAQGALGLDARNIARKDELRLGKVLRKLGFDKRAMGKGDDRGKRWVRVEKSKHAEISANWDIA